jgi:hypothetical protein
MVRSLPFDLRQGSAHWVKYYTFDPLYTLSVRTEMDAKVVGKLGS